MAITSGNDKISIQHEQTRAVNQQKIDAAKDASTAEKNEAINVFEEAWGKIGTNDSEEAKESFGASILEAGQDFLGALDATRKVVWETLEDQATQQFLEAYDWISDTADEIEEFGDKAKNVGGNILAFTKGIFGALAEAGEAEIQKRQNGNEEESEEA